MTVPDKTVVFARDPKYADPFSPDSDAAWDSIMPGIFELSEYIYITDKNHA